MHASRPANHRPRTSRRLGYESLEGRALLAATPTIELCECSDTGVKKDGVTSDVTPRFVGTATPRATVTLAIEGGATLGTARANAFGTWAFVTRGRRLTDNLQTIRVTERAADGTTVGSSTTTIMIDRVKPTVSIEKTGIDTFRVSFSRPVTGFGSDLAGVVVSGRPIGGRPFVLPATSARFATLVGQVEFTAASNGQDYDIRLPEAALQPGTYTIRLRGLQSRIVDSVAGNRLSTDGSLTFGVA